MNCPSQALEIKSGRNQNFSQRWQHHRLGVCRLQMHQIRRKLHRELLQKVAESAPEPRQKLHQTSKRIAPKTTPSAPPSARRTAPKTAAKCGRELLKLGQNCRLNCNKTALETQPELKQQFQHKRRRYGRGVRSFRLHEVCAKPHQKLLRAVAGDCRNCARTAG